MEFVSLCYHYIKDAKRTERYPRIYANMDTQLEEHTKLFTREYHPLSPEDIRRQYVDKQIPAIDRTGVVVTFDDGLNDHYLAAQILARNGIRAFFFVPTCILTDRLPANPQIIHYTLALHGIAAFLSLYDSLLEARDLHADERFRVRYKKGRAAETIAQIKKIFKYELPAATGREILLTIYNRLLLTHTPHILDDIHLTETQIRKMLDMGHMIGTHTHTHISVAATQLTPEEFHTEVIKPKQILREMFNTPVYALSYPFGGKADCLATKDLIQTTSVYDLAFTVEKRVNTEYTSPLEIGRYEPYPGDDTDVLQDKLLALARV